MGKTEFKTDYRIGLEQRNRAICEEYRQLTSQEGVSLTKVQEYLCKKYGLHSKSSIWGILKQGEAQEAQS